eukprot:SAG31_NODE_1984_length_6740_cov_4.949255_2_plen_65_part_00
MFEYRRAPVPKTKFSTCSLESVPTKFSMYPDVVSVLAIVRTSQVLNLVDLQPYGVPEAEIVPES